MKKIIILLMLIVFCGTVQATMSYNDWGNEYSTNIIGLWNSSDTNQTTLLDQVNSNHGTLNGYTFSNGTVSGATLTDGKFGKAYNFSGADTITIPFTSQLDLEVSDHMTITAWINQDVDVNGGRIIDRWSEVIFRNTNGELEFILNSLVGDDRVSGITTIGVNQWVHVAARYNGTHLAVFVNGEEDGADPVSGDYAASAANWVMGATFNGSIDEPRIWDRALTDSELRAEMNATNPVAIQGLVGSWSFEKNHGTSTQDTHHIVNGTIGSAIRFDGINDYVDVTDVNKVNITNNEMTITAWVKKLDSTTHVIADKSDSAVANGWRLRISNNDRVTFFVGNGSSRRVDSNVGEELNNDQWHFIAGVVNASHCMVYIDGALQTNDIQGCKGAITRIAGVKFSIGRRHVGATDYFNGSIDDVIIWNRSFTPAEIANLYDSYIGGCVTPVEDLSITTDTTFCQGTYDLNDSNNNGVITLGANNVVLNCNGATLQGNLSSSTYGMYLRDRDSVKIHNCTIIDYSRGMRIRNMVNSNFTNNTIISSSVIGAWFQLSSTDNIMSNSQFYDNAISIYIEGTSNNTIIRNNIINNSATYGIYADGNWRTSIFENIFLTPKVLVTTTADIRILGEGGNHNIYDNKINGSKFGIRIDNANSDSNITNNNVTGTGHWSISTTTGANRTKIIGNRILYSGWNSIYLGSFNNTVNSNFIDTYVHHGIDMHDVNFLLSGGNNISYNTIVQTKGQSYGDSAIFISNGNDNRIYNNNISNMINSTLDSGSTDAGLGITVEGNRSEGNMIYNNTLTNISGFCIRDGGINNTYMNNVFDGCNWEVVVRTLSAYPNMNQSATFINNIASNGIFIYKSTTTDINVTINETSTNYHLFNLSNKGVIKFKYNGRKDFRINNNTLTVRSFPTTNNQIFNGSSETPTSENAKTFTESIPANNRTLVFSFDVDSPTFSRLPKNLTNISFSFKDNQFKLNTSGTGTIGIKSLANIKGPSGLFEHRSLDSLVGQTNADPYEFPMTASNTFIPFVAPSNGDDPSSPSNPAGPLGNDPEVEIIPDNVSQLKPITKLDQIQEKFLNSTKKLKEFIIGSTKKPSSFIENWKDLNLFDRVLLIGSVVFIIVFVAVVIWMIPKKKKPKKKKKKNEDVEVFI